MQMHQVRYFLAVAEELNFTRAAERCNVTQPSLSRANKLSRRSFEGCFFTASENRRTFLRILATWPGPHFQSVYDQSRLVKRLSQEF